MRLTITLRFRSESAAASLKLVQQDRGVVATRRFPQRIRCGLIEARMDGAMVLAARLGFRSESAAASLKHFSVLLCRADARQFPQRIRCGLIEALAPPQTAPAYRLVSAANPLRPH